jgi:putative membrane protein
MSEQGRTIVLTIAIVVLALVVLPLLWGGMMMGPGMFGPGVMGGWVGAGPWFGGLGLIFWMLILAGLGLVVAWAVRQPSRPDQRNDQPLDILKSRYARGELTREQYEQMRRDLE